MTPIGCAARCARGRHARHSRPPQPQRAVRYDRHRYRGRHLLENAFCRLKDFRRIATHYDKLAANFLSAVGLATAVAFWL